MEKKVLYIEVDTTNYKGIFRVKEILGNIVAVDINGTTTDFYINNKKEIVKFCDVNGKNFSFKPND